MYQIKRKDKAFFIGQMEANIQGNGRMESKTDMVYIYCQIMQRLKDDGKMEKKYKTQKLITIHKNLIFIKIIICNNKMKKFRNNSKEFNINNSNINSNIQL